MEFYESLSRSLAQDEAWETCVLYKAFLRVFLIEGAEPIGHLPAVFGTL